MNKFCIIAVMFLLAGGGIFVAMTNSSVKQEIINQKQNEGRKVLCTLCNGTGKAGSGVKGKGNYSCTRCKGTGWM